MKEDGKINKMYQVSTLQALVSGYTRSVITVEELLQHGDIGLGTYSDLNGEMILVDGKCYQANVNGVVEQVDRETGVSFCSVTFFQQERRETLSSPASLEELKTWLDVKIEEKFGLNSMHMVRIDGYFDEIRARSEVPYRSHHIALRDILSKTQQDFTFKNLKGTLVCVYFPDYLDGLNAAGWHFHFVSEGRTLGGHVLDLHIKEGEAVIDKVPGIEVQLPMDPAFDTYSLKNAMYRDSKGIEYGY